MRKNAEGRVGVVINREGGTADGRPVVEAFAPGSPNEHVGLAPGDVFTSVNGQPCATLEAALAALGGAPAGAAAFAVTLERGIQVGDVGCVMLTMVNFHGLRINVGFQRVVRVREIR